MTLESTEHSLLIIEERARSDIIVGVPHHAPAGVPFLPCPEHSDSDENTGFIGRYLAERLDCCSVIACNATVDPNKHLHSDYTMQIASWSPSVLIEIHGHGKVRSPYDVEISCGSAKFSTHSEALAAGVNRRLSEDTDFVITWQPLCLRSINGFNLLLTYRIMAASPIGRMCARIVCKRWP